MDKVLKKIAEDVAGWAKAKPEIGEVWFFGSRVKGTHREDSDLDIALVMRDPSRPKGSRYGDWIFESDDWENELRELVPYMVDLDIGDSDIATNVVAPALLTEGVCVFSRTTCEAK